MTVMGASHTKPTIINTLADSQLRSNISYTKRQADANFERNLSYQKVGKFKLKFKGKYYRRKNGLVIQVLTKF